MTQFEDDIELPKGTNHLLAIAIDAYTNGIRGLNNCVRDAEKVIELLTEKYHFEPENTCFLKNENATYQNIIERLEDFNRKLGENDNLLIYFSGHGTFNPETNLGYLLPVDAQEKKVHTFFHQLVLKAYLKAYKAKHILLIIDSCYSGAVLTKELDAFTQKTNKLPSRWVLTSGHLETVSDGDFGKKHSPFAEAILNYLHKNTQEALSILELVQHVTKIVANNQKQTPLGEPLQDANHGGGLFFFFLKKQDETAFKACKSKTDFEHFIHKHKNSPFIPQANAQIAAFLQTEAQELYDKIIAADWHEKPALCKQFRATYKEINKQLYKQVQQEGINADIYLAWQKVNKKNVFAIDAFLDEHENSFLDTEIKATLKQAEDASIAEDDRILAQKKQRLKEEAERKKREKEAKDAKHLQEEAERKAKEDPFHGLMVKIPAGSFEMGSNEDSDSQPIHKVTIKAFEMCKYQVTQKQWQMIMGENPSHFKGDDLPVEQVSSNDIQIFLQKINEKIGKSYFKGDDLPVEQVSWNDIQIFLQKLNEKTGKNYRLPSEAEWEYAARGGQNYKFSGSDNIDEVAWYKENSGGRTHPVGQKKANRYGLYDMSGNVWEWCEDSWHSDYKGAPIDGSAWIDDKSLFRVYCGCSWYSNSFYMRLTYRNYHTPSIRINDIGFRICLA